jgi:nitrous oxidase accessory protein
MTAIALIACLALCVAAERGSIADRIACAAPGDVIEVGPGVYRERIRIDKPLRLVGVGRPVIDGGGSGDIVEIVAPSVEFSGFEVRNTGIDLDKENCAIRVLAPLAIIEDNVLSDVLFGIDLKGASDSVVRGNRIGGKDLDVARRGDGLRLWRSDRVRIEHNEIHDGRDAILWYSNAVEVRGNVAHRCRYGFHLMYSDNVVLEDNEVSQNSVGVYFMYSHSLELRRNRLVRNRGPSGYGLGLKETDRFTIEDNVIVGNRVGVYIDGSPFTSKKPGEFTRNTFAFNDIGVTFLPAVRGNVLWENNFVDNVEQVCVLGRGELVGNEFARDDRGNYWSDYVGYDEDRDGLGDWEHYSERLFESMLDREPKLRVFLLSPAESAIEFVARAVPAVRPEPKFSDPAPLMQPVATRIEVDRRAPRGALAVAAAAMLTIGGLAFIVARSGLGLAREST